MNRSSWGNSRCQKNGSAENRGPLQGIPDVTIGLPVYNGEEFLRKTICSLLNQSFENFEIVISDNDSTDSTEDICRELEKKDNRVRYVRQKINIGAIENFQFVLNEARGKYFMWAAHDDLWDKEYLNVLVTILDDNKKSSIAFSKIVGIDVDDKIIWDCPWTFDLPSKIRLLRLIKYISQDDYHRKAIIFYGLMRTSLIKKSSGFRIRSRCSEGLALYVVFSILMHGNIALSNDVSF